MGRRKKKSSFLHSLIIYATIAGLFSIGKNDSDEDDTEYLDSQSQYESEENTESLEPEIDISDIPEEQFKDECLEIEYNDLSKEWIGKFVTKEILFTDSMQDEYVCASTEDYIEDYKEYQHTYRVYDIYDCRFDKSFPIYYYDVTRIYGEIIDIGCNYANGLDYPIINMYYADYIRKWRHDTDTSKSIDDIKKERIDEQINSD